MNRHKPDLPLVRDVSGKYIVTRFLLSEDDILSAAEMIIEQRFLREACIDSVADTKQFLRAKLVTHTQLDFVHF